MRYFTRYHEKIAGWIDFELLIKNITNDIEKIMDRLDNDNMDSTDKDKYQHGIVGYPREILLAESFNILFKVEDGYKIFIKKQYANNIIGINRKAVMKVLRTEFDGLCDSLCIYLEDIEPHLRIYPEEFSYKQVRDIQADVVVSFNYTDTYKRYDIDPAKVIHVHGSLDKRNIVLGFHDDNEKELQYAYFKKYMQCILKQTPILEQYEPIWKLKPTLYIFGDIL